MSLIQYRATTLHRLRPIEDGHREWTLGKLRLWNFLQWFLAAMCPLQPSSDMHCRESQIKNWTTRDILKIACWIVGGIRY